MKDMGRVKGSSNMAVPLYIGHNIVYIHSNIEQTDDGSYEYNELQCNKNEFYTYIFQNLKEQNASLTDIEDALIELASIVSEV
jgi:hypothetical protein